MWVTGTIYINYTLEKLNFKYLIPEARTKCRELLHQITTFEYIFV